MERGSPSRTSWADEVEEEESRARSRSGLNPNVEPFSPGAASLGMGERLSFSDSEASSGSDEPTPVADDQGKEVLPAAGRRRRPRRRRRHRRQAALGGFMADAKRPPPPPPPHDRAPAPSPPHVNRIRSIVVHPARLSAEPDEDGFHEVHSRRRWLRRSPPRAVKPVPEDLIDLCFNCLGNNHVKAECTFPSRCRSCRQEGHRARFCPNASRC